MVCFYVRIFVAWRDKEADFVQRKEGCKHIGEKVQQIAQFEGDFTKFKLQNIPIPQTPQLNFEFFALLKKFFCSSWGKTSHVKSPFFKRWCYTNLKGDRYCVKTYSFLLAGPDGWVICKQANVQGNLSKHFAWPVIFYKTACIISYWKCSLGFKGALKQVFPNSIKGWWDPPSGGNQKFCRDKLFYQVVGTWGGVILTTSTFFKAKSNFL